MKFGLDVLGGAKYKNLLIKEWPHGFYLGIFAEAFGDAYPVVDAILKTGKCPGVRVHLIWNDLHQYGDKDIKKLVFLSQKYNQLAKKYSQYEIRLSPFCEHNLSSPDKYLDIVNEEAPDCLGPVNTIWKGKLSNLYINEIHGTDKDINLNYIFSFDGCNCVDCDIEKLKIIHSDSDTFFFWHPRFNLKWSMKDTTPRPERKAFPTKELFRSIVFLAKNKGDTYLPKTWLSKSHAERHGAVDTKGDKLLIISPIKASKIELKTSKGKPIESLKLFGSYSGGGFRYYSSTWGYLVAERAIKAQGHPLCDVIVNGKKYGVINPGFRDATFRD